MARDLLRDVERTLPAPSRFDAAAYQQYLAVPVWTNPKMWTMF